MGLAVDGRRLALGTRNQVWFLRNAPDIAPRVEPAGRHDACFLPRSCHVTGDIGVHELAWAGDELWVVNTRFSCLCTLDPDYSFVPRWRPPFITALAAEDRCHLNGLAMVGRPAAVRHRPGRDRHAGRLAGRQGARRLPDRRAPAARSSAAACRCRTRRAGTTAGSGCWNRGPGGSVAGRPRHRPARDGGRAARLHPRPGAVRPVRLRRPVEDPRDVACSAACPSPSGVKELKCGVAVVDLRTGTVVGLPGVPDGGGGDLRRAGAGRQPVPGGDRFLQERGAGCVHRAAGGARHNGGRHQKPSTLVGDHI